MATKIQLRRDTAANWTTNDPTLATGEAGYETDTGKLKLGDGTTAWTSLTYYTTVPGNHSLAGAEHSSDTLANLNSKVSDATLIDTGDSRLSDARTPTAHTHGLADVTDSGALAAKNTVATADVDNDAITYDKIQNVSATNKVLGRDTAGAGVVEEISPAALRTMLNVEDGSTADQSDAEIKTAYENNANTNEFSDAEKSKLAGISGTNTGDEPSASLTVQGIVELATQTEVNTGTDTTRALVPSTLANSTLASDVTTNNAKISYPSADSTKLAGIESGATADQTNGEIKTAYEANADTNAFSDAEQTKLAGIETAADVTDSTNVNAAGAVMNSDSSTASMSFVLDEDNMTSDSATKVPTQQSVKKYVDDKVVSSVDYKGGYNASTNTPDLDTTPSGILKGDMYTVTVAGTFFATALEIGDVLIAEIDSAAVEADWSVVQKDMDAASIKTSYESNADTNEFSDAEQSKLAGIETSATADQTGAEIKTAYEAEPNTNAFTDAEQTNLGNQSGTNTGDEPDASTTVKGIVELATDGESIANVAVQGNDSRLSDARTPTAHNHTLADVTDSGSLAAKNTVATADMDNDSITYAKIQNVSATNRILGRDTAGAGDVEEIAPAALRTMINVSDGSTANDTDANLKARANHTGTQTASTISDFDTEVSNNSSVAANTAKVTNATHTGEVTGSGALTIDKTAISGKALVTAVGTDHFLIGDASDTDNLKKALVSDVLSGAGHTIQEEGSSLTSRTKLNFIGTNVTATDNPGNDATDVTITGGAATDLAAVQARRSTTYTCTGSFVSLTFDTTDFENDAARVKHNDTTTSRIDILEAGVYELFYDITIHGDATSRTTQTRIYKNGTTLVAGSDMSILSDGGNTTDNPVSMDRKVIVDLALNDYIEVQVTDTNAVEVNAGASLIVTKLEGLQGAAGATGIAGADGDMTWEGNWVSQNYTANQAVKYTNGNSYVCKLNTVSSEVPTNATYWDILAEKGDAGSAQSRLDISIHPHNGDSKNTASATYVTQARMLWGGSTLLGTPSKIYANSWQAAAGSGNVRVYDLTNSATIAESASITSTSGGNIVDLGTISNVTTGQAVWLIQDKGDGTNTNEISSASVEF